MQIFDFIKRLKVTVLSAIHDLNMAALYCDRIYVLKEGKVILSGTPEEVFTAENIYGVYGVRSVCLLYTSGMDKEETKEDGKYIRRERYSGQCTRSFYVGDGVSKDDIKAKYEEGILKLTLPKEEPKEIENKKYISIEG